MRRYKGQDVLLSASLVESVRIDGLPRQKTILHLGSILQSKARSSGSEDYITRDVKAQIHFWAKVFSRLKKINLSEAEKHRLRSKIEEMVRLPEPSEFRSFWQFNPPDL
jgi:hypothetical protein